LKIKDLVYNREKLPVKQAAFFLHPRPMKNLMLIIAAILSTSASLGGQTADSTKVISLTPRDFSVKYRENPAAVLLDVREFFEYKKTRIDNAVNLPSSGNIDLAADTMKKDLSYFLYCTSGVRSRRVGRQLASHGLAYVYSLEGGINGWKKEGLPVNKKKVRKK
jgi:rhodanese-related sulfurtransferase